MIILVLKFGTVYRFTKDRVRGVDLSELRQRSLDNESDFEARMAKDYHLRMIQID